MSIIQQVIDRISPKGLEEEERKTRAFEERRRRRRADLRPRIDAEAAHDADEDLRRFLGEAGSGEGR